MYFHLVHSFVYSSSSARFDVQIILLKNSFLLINPHTHTKKKDWTDERSHKKSNANYMWTAHTMEKKAPRSSTNWDLFCFYRSRFLLSFSRIGMNKKEWFFSVTSNHDCTRSIDSTHAHWTISKCFFRPKKSGKQTFSYERMVLMVI